MSFLLKKDDLLGPKTELSTTMNRKDTTTINTTATTINSSSSGTSNISSSLIAATTSSSSTTEKDYCTQNLEIVFKHVVVDGANEINPDANGTDQQLATEKSKPDNNTVKVNV